MLANNINMIISGTTAIVRDRFVYPWATNNTFLWLNWTPLVSWYALKIRPWNSEIEQHFSYHVSWIDVLCPWLIFWLIVAYRERLNGITGSANITIQHFRTTCFYCKNNTWRNPRDFLVKRVSVLSIFIATAYNILRFSTISEIKEVNSHQIYWPSPPRVCLHMSNDTPWQVKLIFYSIPTAYKLTVSQAWITQSSAKRRTVEVMLSRMSLINTVSRRGCALVRNPGGLQPTQGASLSKHHRWQLFVFAQIAKPWSTGGYHFGYHYTPVFGVALYRKPWQSP